MQSLYPTTRDTVVLTAGFLLSGLATYCYQKLTQPRDAADKKIKEVFAKLQIKEWHLPGLSSQMYAQSANAPRPIFNEKTQEDLAVIKQRIEKSRDNNGLTVLPNLIFQGPPGVGKTMSLQDLFLKSGIGFIRVPSGTMEGHIKIDGHIQALHKILEISEQCEKPVFIIMDDGEQLVAQRPSQTKKTDVDNKNVIKASWISDKEKMSDILVQRRINLVNAILEESGKDQRRVAFAVTTNRTQAIDAAFRTRAHTITIAPPAEQERKHIIAQHLPSIFKDDSTITFFDPRVLSYMAKKTEGFTGRNLVKLLEDIHANVQLDHGDITEDTIDAAIVGAQESVVGMPAAGSNAKAAIDPYADHDAAASKESLPSMIANKFKALFAKQ